MSKQSAQEREAHRRERERRRRARQARKALLALLKRLRRACGKISTLEEWLDYTQELADLLVTYQDGLTKEQRERLERAMKAADLTEKGIQLACKALQGELKQVIAALPAGLLGLPVPALVALSVGAVAVVIGGGVLLWQQVRQAVGLTMVNQGCPPLEVGSMLTPETQQTLARLGIHLPERVATDAQETLSLPPLPADLTVDAQRPPTLTLRLKERTGTFAATLDLTLDPRIETVLLDNTPLLGKAIILPLDQAGEHELVIRCHGP